jgi:hypothetical protein
VARFEMKGDERSMVRHICPIAWVKIGSARHGALIVGAAPALEHPRTALHKHPTQPCLSPSFFSALICWPSGHSSKSLLQTGLTAEDR